MTDLYDVQNRPAVDPLLPEAARRYLAHTAEGRPIRDIAREAGCHASTILRQVRKLETLREDPLVDQVLGASDAPPEDMANQLAQLDDAAVALRRLCEARAMLLYSPDLPQPAIVKTVGEGETVVLGKVDVALAAALVLRNWLEPVGGTTVMRYRVTQEGRSCLPGLMAARDGRAARPADAPGSVFSDAAPDRRSRDRSHSTGPGFESPIAALARRRGADGKPFLPSEFVVAGDRLHEDFAVAGFTASDLLGWESADALHPHYATASSLRDARRSDAMIRTLDAIKDLGPGLSEVVLRCCCLREGLEATEKRLGWSARSGKVVLRIALQRLTQFYTQDRTRDGVLIG